MIVYLDTSSLLKFHVEERGSDTVRMLMTSATSLVMSQVAYAEARSGLARAHNSGRLSAEAHAAARRSFELQWADMVIVDVSTPLVQMAGDLAERYLLRGFDAIHLASALISQSHGGEPITFSAWDDRLLSAAQDEGLTVAPIGP